MPAQALLTAPVAIGLQLSVEFFPTGRLGNRHHEISAGVTDKIFDLALVVALARTAELLREQVMAL